MGGTASSCDSSPSKFTLTQLYNQPGHLPIDQTAEMTSGCGSDIGGPTAGDCLDTLKSKGFGWPNNGEFEWGGRGNNCSLCSFNYGCECAGGIGGRRGTVKRIHFSGDPTKCCTTPSSKWWDGTGTTPNEDTDKTCDPDSKDFNKTYCDATMNTYCQGNNITSAQCQDWVTKSVNAGRGVASTVMNTYCSQGANYKNPTCQNWVSALRGKAGTSIATAADNALMSYCQNNPTDPNCACEQPPQNVTAVQELMTLPKVCWYTPCKNTGGSQTYITAADIETRNHCVSTTCYIQAGDINIQDSKNVSINMSNQCKTELLKPGIGSIPEDQPAGTSAPPSIGGSDVPPSSNGPTSTPPKAASNNNTLLLGGGGILGLSSCSIFFIIIIVIIVMMMRKKEETG